MIRIHLEKGFNRKGTPSENTEIIEGDGADSQRKAIINLLLLFLVPGVLYIYEQVVIPEKQDRNRVVEQKLSNLRQTNAKFQSTVSEITKLKSDLERIRKQTSVIGDLSSKRIREVQLLDSVQRDISERVWLTNISIVQGKVDIQAMALSESDTSTFIETLSRSVFLKKVGLIKSEEIKTPNGILRKFQVAASMEGE